MIPYNTDAPLYHMPVATVGLIILNTLLFFAVPSSMVQPEVEVVGQENDEGIAIVNPFAMNASVHYPSNTLSLEHGNGIKPWQWLTSIFMHADFFHLLFNMIALWAFGLVVEGKVGSMVFLALYVGIGVAQSGMEQMLLSFASPGGSLGASAAIFGILGIAVVWAPRNDFDVFWSLGFHIGTIEIPIMVYGFISFALEAVGVVFGRFGISSSVLHLMGLFIGVALGFLWLRRGWVDCEGWDVLSVWHGKEGKHEENSELDNEARDLIRTSLNARREQKPQAGNHSEQTAAAPPRVSPQVAESPDPEQFADLWAGQAPQAAEVRATPASGTLADLEQLIDAGNATTAVKLLSKLRHAGRAPELPQPLLGKLIRDLLTAKAYDSAIPLMSEHTQRFNQSRIALQLNLAKILLHLERPKKAIAVLRNVEASKLDEQSRSSWQRLAAHAKKLIADGVIELGD